MGVPKRQVKMLFVAVLVLLSLANSRVLANRAIMNPMEMEEDTLDSDPDIRNGHGQGFMDDDEAEPATEDLKPELRVSSPTSEVSQLLEEDDFRTTDQAAKHPSSIHPQDAPRMDCSKITMQIFQVLLQNPDSVEPEDYSCGLLNLISHFEKFNGRIRSLESNLHTATNTIKSLESSLRAEISKTQSLVKELNDTVHKEAERAIKAENVIARRVLSEKSRVDMIQKNMTEAVHAAYDQVKETTGLVRNLEQQWQGMMSKQMMQKEPQTFSPSPQMMAHLQPMPQTNINEQNIHKIELKLSSLQEFIQELSNRISNMESGSEHNVNSGITQIFKTYASLAHEIEKETERAAGEEANLKSFITSEISTVSKSISALQERIAEEKNRVQVIENRRTADLFEEINRAKSEENRLGLKLKDEMSKAAAAFKRLEIHVDTQLNTTRIFEVELKSVTDNVTRRVLESEEKLTEQISFERNRALSAETSLKTHLETEVSRAMAAENELVRLTNEERERARVAEQELKAALDVEIYRAKGVEFSMTAQITAEAERAKQEETQLHEHINANMTRLLTDIIKEFTRAQNAEKELEDKILSEKSRAITSEQSIMTGLNSEMNRATEREQELYGLIQSQGNSTTVVDKVRSMIESETFRATQMETKLEGQIQAEINRARGSEDKLYSLVNDDLLDKFRSVEYNVTQATSEILRYSRELELEVRKTVMAEVARAVDSENAIKQQLSAEVERATQAEMLLSRMVAANYSDISSRFQDMSKENEKDSLRLEDISLQISRNLTGDILTLAELFDDKLDDLEKNENIRLKKVEDDMKKCCSGSSWRWRSLKGKSDTGSGSEGVLNKIMQVFGSIAEDSTAPASKKASRKSASKSSSAATDRSLKSSSENSDEEIKEDVYSKSSPDTIAIKNTRKNSTSFQTIDSTSNKPRNANIANATVVFPANSNFGRNSGESEKTLQRLRQARRPSSLRDNRGVNSNSNKVVSVQSANSKVTSTFG